MTGVQTCALPISPTPEAPSSGRRSPAAERRNEALDIFFFNDTATTEIYTTEDTLSLHDALPISFLREATINNKHGVFMRPVALASPCSPFGDGEKR